MSPDSPWTAQRERGALWAMRLLVWGYRWVGRPVARLLLVPTAAYFLLTGRPAREASRGYLERLRAAFPDLEARLPGRPGLAQGFRHFHAFARVVLDRAGFLMERPEQWAIEVEGMEELDRVAREGLGALVLGAHIGSFDALRLLASERSPIAVNVLMYTANAERINRILDELAGGEGIRVQVIPVRPGTIGHVLQARDCVRRGEVVAVLADRLPPAEGLPPGGGDREVRVPFLGAPARLPQGPWLLAATLGCPVLWMVGLRRGERRYRIRVERLADRLDLPRSGREQALSVWARTYAERMEAACREAPFQWFNFYDFWEAPGSRATD